jgi:hypothetical protein
MPRGKPKKPKVEPEPDDPYSQGLKAMTGA